MRQQKKKQIAIEEGVPNILDDVENDESVQNLVQDNDVISTNPDEDLYFLKTININEENMPVIKQKIIATTSHRRKMLLNKNLDLLESFPVFLHIQNWWV